jgi:hypothetical protein
MSSKISESGMEDGCREKFVCEILASQLGTGGVEPGTDYDQLGGEGDPLKNEANQLTRVSQLSLFRGQNSTIHAASPRKSQVWQRRLNNKTGPRSFNPPPPFASKRYIIAPKAHHMSLKWESFVVPAIRVLSLAWAPRGLHRAMFMNSVSHGKAWTKNAASPLNKPCFTKECMLGGYLSKNLPFPPPPTSLPPTNCQLGPITFCLRIGQLGGGGGGVT